MDTITKQCLALLANILCTLHNENRRLFELHIFVLVKQPLGLAPVLNGNFHFLWLIGKGSPYPLILAESEKQRLIVSPDLVLCAT